MRAGQQRKLERAVHLAAGTTVAAYIYLPLGDAVADAIRWAALPVLVGSGLAMWQMARIRRALKRRNPRHVTARNHLGET
jgi:predicted MFS family arabinose efflux permease